MYNELPFLERFAAAAADGFEAVEYLFPYEFPAAEIGQRLRERMQLRCRGMMLREIAEQHCRVAESPVHSKKATPPAEQTS